MKNIARAATLFLLLSAGCNGCGAWAPPATCAPCGDGSLVCTGTVAACAEENAGGCQTTIGAAGAAILVLRSDGSYIETTADGTTTGSWSVASAGSGVVLAPNGSTAKAVVGVYTDACPYAPQS